MIVCEGTVSEPKYFDGLAKEATPGLGYKITISPKPPIEKDKQEKTEPTPAPKRGRRALKDVEDEPEYEFMPQEGFTSQPVSYVWEARDGLKNGQFDEAWAVFDRDGHASHEKAFEIANEKINGQNVRIAFSSVAFEVWVLLHFELNTTAFSKSHCRTGKNDYHQCGQGSDARDCHGANCPTGRLKGVGYVSIDTDIKDIPYKNLSPRSLTAIDNALELRRILYKNDIQILPFEVNPYTSVDRLVFKILNLEKDYKWTQFSKVYPNGIPFELSFDNNHELNIKFTNNSSSVVIIQPLFLKLVNIKGEEIEFLSRGVYQPGEEMQITISTNEFVEFNPKYVSFPINGDTNGIAEIPFN